MKTYTTNGEKEEFLKIAFEYLVKNGLENTSVRNICKSTGMSIGSAYYWFANKEEMLICVAEYGLADIADRLFAFAIEKLENIDEFVNEFIKEIKRYQPELRFVYQVATSPIYGERLRNSARGINDIYESAIYEVADVINVLYEEVAPIVYMFLAVTLDYVIWDDFELSKKQIEYLAKLLNGLKRKEKNI